MDAKAWVALVLLGLALAIAGTLVVTGGTVVWKRQAGKRPGTWRWIGPEQPCALGSGPTLPESFCLRYRSSTSWGWRPNEVVPLSNAVVTMSKPPLVLSVGSPSRSAAAKLTGAGVALDGSQVLVVEAGQVDAQLFSLYDRGGDPRDRCRLRARADSRSIFLPTAGQF